MTRINFKLPHMSPLLDNNAPQEATLQATEQPQNAPRSFVAPLLRTERQRLALAFVAGLLVGLTVLGWWLFPVRWVDAWPVDLSPQEQALYLEMTADLYAYSLDPSYALRALHSWPDASVICRLADQQTDWGTKIRLISIAVIKNGQGCPVQGGE